MSRQRLPVTAGLAHTIIWWAVIAGVFSDHLGQGDKLSARVPVSHTDALPGCRHRADPGEAARQPCSGHAGCSSACNSRAVSSPGVKRAISGPAGNTGSSRRRAQGPGLQAVQRRHPLGSRRLGLGDGGSCPPISEASSWVGGTPPCPFLERLLPEHCAGGAGGSDCPAGTQAGVAAHWPCAPQCLPATWAPPRIWIWGGKAESERGPAGR